MLEMSTKLPTFFVSVFVGFSCLYDHIFAENFKIMSRGRGKGKKLNVNHEDAGSGEDEKLPTQKRRRRPQKPLKDEFDDEEVEKVEESAYYLVLFIQKKRHKEKEVDSNGDAQLSCKPHFKLALASGEQGESVNNVGNKVVLGSKSHQFSCVNSTNTMILSHLANYKSMLEVFEAGGDFHSRTAMNMYPYIRDAVNEKHVLLEWHLNPQFHS
ncbi:hypothetical protein Ahy_A02g006178 isoform A [Arachis hypogaea]|uniref:Uncharacterized protein n=2 Tax=Arachis hypogaea TaxID=3818 RepID=A0A445E943_ARAHY|nr:hypothetical protein Ahy_A02g006178 isoform A [Arachis hypogaea]